MTKAKKTAQTPALPADLFKGGRDKISAYVRQIHTCREAAANRIDLSYQLFLALDPEAQERGFLPALIAQFEAAGHHIGKQTLSDDIKIFRVLRLGLGMSRAEVTSHAYRRMRTLAQNAEWTLANPDEARRLLSDPAANDEVVRAALLGSKAAAAKPVVLKLKLKPADLKKVDKALVDVARSLKKSGQPVPENRDELLLTVISEWRALKKAAATSTRK